MNRMTYKMITTNSYILTGDKKYSEEDLINLLGKREDELEKITERSGKLLESVYELLEATKGEKEELMQKIRRL